MIKGNKGEWSELYVLVSLMSKGLLYQSDIFLNKDENNKYEVLKGYKSEIGYNLEFSRTDTVNVLKDNIQIATYSFDEMQKVAEVLYKEILNSKGTTFDIQAVQNFIQDCSIQKLKAKSTEKADIRLRIYDHRLAKETDLGFSIKSLLGSNSTLFNTGSGNNFIYSVEDKLDSSLEDFNSKTYKPPTSISKITYRLQQLELLKANFSFDKIQSFQLWKNLKMIDGDLPEILAWGLYYRWMDREASLSKVAQLLEDRDPLNFYDGEHSEQKLYEYKLKRFLTESAMGMTSETPWLGEYDSFGGVIIAKKDGDIVCFHIYDFNVFRTYLLENTIFEQPSTSEDGLNPGNVNLKSKKTYRYGWLYRDNNDLKFKINLQIRFK